MACCVGLSDVPEFFTGHVGFVERDHLYVYFWPELFVNQATIVELEKIRITSTVPEYTTWKDKGHLQHYEYGCSSADIYNDMVYFIILSHCQNNQE